MIDVIAFLIEHFQDFDACQAQDDLGELLEEVGFDDQEIGEALWFVDALKAAPAIPADALRQSTAMRVYCTQELDVLPTEVYGLLHFLEQNSAINPEQREFVIHALLGLSGDDITIDHAKVLTLLVLWAHQSELPILIGDELMASLSGEAIMH